MDGKILLQSCGGEGGGSWGMKSKKKKKGHKKVWMWMCLFSEPATVTSGEAARLIRCNWKVTAPNKTRHHANDTGSPHYIRAITSVTHLKPAYKQNLMEGPQIRFWRPLFCLCSVVVTVNCFFSMLVLQNENQLWTSFRSDRPDWTRHILTSVMLLSICLLVNPITRINVCFCSLWICWNFPFFLSFLVLSTWESHSYKCWNTGLASPPPTERTARLHVTWTLYDTYNFWNTSFVCRSVTCQHLTVFPPNQPERGSIFWCCSLQ